MRQTGLTRIAIIGAGAASLAAATGCGGGATTVVEMETQPTSTAAPTTQAPPAQTSTPGGSTASSVQPPSGSNEVQKRGRKGVSYARYSTAETPSQVVDYYRGELSNEGWTVRHEGKGGGGWGRWGGSEAGLWAVKGDDYAAVQAGGESGHTTYFEVCVGPNRSITDDCEDMTSGGSRGGDDRDDDSGGS